MSRALRRATLAAAAAAGALALAAGPAAAADPIMPLSEVTSGMVGEARTVVRGTDIVSFPVRILDVQRATDGPGGTVILARAEGPLMEQTGGVAEGMSGSPVYVTGPDGVPRVVGAVAFGQGDQENVIIGLTPIEQMIDSSAGQRALERPPPPLVARRVTVVADRAAARRLEARHPGRIGLYPLTRWMVAGASRPLIGPLSHELARSGIQLTSIGPRATRPAVPLVPGASMTALLAGGDIAIGAIGTVTYVDGATVLGFGHPFLSAGRARFLLGDGYVLQTIPAPIAGASYKLAEPGTLRGMVTSDRADGITGALGPVEGISAVGTARYTARGTTSTVRGTIAPDPRTAPIVAGLVQDEPAARVLDGIAGGTVTLRISISSPDLRRPLVYRNVYASAGDVVTMASGQLSRLLAILMQNGVRPVPVTDVAVDQVLQPRIRAARITGARVTPRRVRPGGRATLLLVVQPWQAASRVVRVPIRIPSGIEPGRGALRIVPNSTDGFDPVPADLTQDFGVESGPVARRVAVAAAERGAAKAEGTRLERLVEGLRRATDDRNDAVRLLGPGEAADEADAGAELAVPYVIYGGRATARIVVRGRR
jgi:SpoIVB peptidase S55